MKKIFLILALFVLAFGLLSCKKTNSHIKKVEQGTEICDCTDDYNSGVSYGHSIGLSSGIGAGIAMGH